VTNVLSAARSAAVEQDLANSSGEFACAGLTDVASLTVPDDLTNVSYVSGDDREVASHRLLDDVWRSLLIGREEQRVARAHVKGKTLLRLFVHDK